jgi:hypothetical protein
MKMKTVTINQVATTPAFQVIALTEALQTLSKSTGISFDSLVEQFPTNAKLQETCAKMLIEAATATAEMMNEI